jgi:hypothetical protein
MTKGQTDKCRQTFIFYLFMVSVEEARDILWLSWQDLSDEEIQRIIKLFQLFANVSISQHIAEKRRTRKDSSQLIKSS